MTTWVGASLGGKYQTMVVRVGHDQSADQPCRYAPAGSPDMLELPVAVLKRNVEGFGEILPQKVGCSCLQRLPVLHQSFNTIGVFGTVQKIAHFLF